LNRQDAEYARNYLAKTRRPGGSDCSFEEYHVVSAWAQKSCPPYRVASRVWFFSFCFNTVAVYDGVRSWFAFSPLVSQWEIIFQRCGWNIFPDCALVVSFVPVLIRAESAS